MANDESCDEMEDPRPCHVPEKKKCAEDGCTSSALSFRDMCWKHLGEENKGKFENEILRRSESESLCGAILTEIELPNCYLREADLRKAHLGGAKLQGAFLSGANLRGALLFGTDLRGAMLWSACLQGADLYDAKLHGASLLGATWRGALNLRASQVGECAEYAKKQWEEGEDIYRRLKNYFHEEGRYEDESWAFVKERTCARKLARQKGRLSKKHMSLWVWWKIANYGEDWKRAARLAVFIILLFALLYYPNPWGRGLIALEGPCPLSPANPVRSLYLSVVTFATLGFGDIRPANTWGALAVITEVLLGYFMLGVTVALVARKMTR